MMKKLYKRPELDIEWFLFEDSITLSGNDYAGEDDFEGADEEIVIPQS